MVLLRRKASIIAVLLTVALLLCGCYEPQKRTALVEANLLSSGKYLIEITGSGPLATLAYQSEILDINGTTQWDGFATIGAYQLAFYQKCQTISSANLSAKRWRGKWAASTATSPKHQVQLWLQMIAEGEGEYDTSPVAIRSLLPVGRMDWRRIVTVTIQDAPLNWDSLCDAHIDALFGSQDFLTAHETGTVILCFDADTCELVGVIFSAENSQTTITGSILLSTADGQITNDIPDVDELADGTLSEEWTIVTS